MSKIIFNFAPSTENTTQEKRNNNIIDIFDMKKETMAALLTILVVCGCGKKQEEVLQPVKVKTETVGAELGSSDGISYSGTIEEMNGVALSFSVGGTVKQLTVDEGQMVSKGQLIGITDGQNESNTVKMSQAAVETAEANYNQAMDAYKRMKMIHDKGSLSDIKWVDAQSKLEQARAALEGAKAQKLIASKGLGDTRLYAPFSGYILRKEVEIGQNVLPGQAVVNLVRIDNVKVKISVPESEISDIHTGASVYVRVDALGGKGFFGKVTEKSVGADPLSHTYEVKAVVANPRHELLPGMIAEVTAGTGNKKSPSANPQTIVIPAGIVQVNNDNRTFVWTVSKGKAKKTFIKIAGNMGKNVVVSSGLNPGDKVVVDGQQKVSSDIAVTE